MGFTAITTRCSGRHNRRSDILPVLDFPHLIKFGFNMIRIKVKHQPNRIIRHPRILTQRRQNGSVSLWHFTCIHSGNRGILHLPLHKQRTVYINYATDHNAATATGDFTSFFPGNIKS
ncbi:hypothetical protein C2134_15800 [Chromobacterium sinusclupearum]|uniref:Uncharacterized protein n=1 Tax=Chromobacterium sinusclupearum TaxID=2077146 RepID=A0A2K4MJM6_9NEIS|nr:hypothetical protein C2134_15800 [Chromobacterium sinusclupearum]